MKVLKTVEEIRHETDAAAIAHIEDERKKAFENNYTIDKASYTYKNKKQKGVVILECWVSSVTKSYGPLWTEEEIDGAKE